MARIREHMESIVQSVVEVDEQSQAISEIIATVTDLAEQAKILAINAAIEAVKAGEQGKGFTIVAQEIRNLATQSKHATTQVRTLLHDIQKAADKAVLVTEQGTKAVEVGEQQALAAGESIRTLAQDMRETAQAVMHLAATSQQQLAGLEQAAVAIGSIKQVAVQNVDGMKQIEQAVQNLQQVGQMLTEIVTQYKLTH
jgi:methyl-accepting chemotaxis protein